MAPPTQRVLQGSNSNDEYMRSVTMILSEVVQQAARSGGSVNLTPEQLTASAALMAAFPSGAAAAPGHSMSPTSVVTLNVDNEYDVEIESTVAGDEFDASAAEGNGSDEIAQLQHAPSIFMPFRVARTTRSDPYATPSQEAPF